METEHYKLLNERFREVEEEVFTKVDKITKHLRQALAAGMKEYETFVLEGLIIIEPYGDDVPEEVIMRFEKLHRYCAILTTDESGEKDFIESWEHARSYDWRYLAHPEEYPEDYSPLTRAFDRIILDGVADGKLTEDDLKYLRPEHIMSYIVISI